MLIEARSFLEDSWQEGDGPAHEIVNPARPSDVLVARVRYLEMHRLDAALASAISARQDWASRSFIVRAVPFGGWKNSGFGPREQGPAAREFFTCSKTVYSRAEPAR